MARESTGTTDVDASRAASGVIHDIGYQRYDGARLGRRSIRRALYLDSFKGAFGIGRTARSKIMPFLLLAAMCLPALIMVVITAVARLPELLGGGYTTYLFSLQLVIAVYVAVQAPVAVSRDLRFSVTSLYLSRPMERVDYVVAKFAALTTAVFALAAAPLTVLFAGALVAGLPLGEQVPDLLRALAGAVLLALLVAGIGLVIAAVTPRRGIGVAAVITVLLVLAGVQGIAGEIAWSAGADTAAIYLGMLSPFTLVDGIQSALLGADSVLLTPAEEVGTGLVFLGTAVLAIVACFAALVVRYRKVSV
jgi:ABC-2 type transport system permease protein